eukprot:Phypoly_transcript_06847.p1 GENE.Phypoly_transcript_06847~~Phypoly_transcript_06847.p1  ORF type:complete len:541 (+),score=95.38 Phypoly_transcript_06847:31-1653(+)
MQTGDQTLRRLHDAMHIPPLPLATSPSDTMTTVYGAPVSEAKYSMTAGPQGPVLMQDTVLMEKISYFARERTPPRNVHALGFGGFGKFTVTHDITKYCSAELFRKIGNTCETFTRFSGVFTERGDADTIRDLRGWATKFYTQQGNWDMLAVNTPAFNARDMKVGPDAIHAFKRDPRNGEWYATQTWDFVATHPEALQTQLMMYTDRVGTPKSFRTQNFFPCNTFSMINAAKERHWVRFHMVSQQGWEGMSRTEAQLIAGENPNFLMREMREAVQKEMFPKWKMFIQVMKEEDGYKFPFAFDCTKVWKHGEFPLIEVGEVVVNRWPDDYHTTTESVAFSPARLIPGIGYSPDRLLQGRLMLYDETQCHRLGPNHQQLPINCPFAKTNQFHAFQGKHPTTEANKTHWPHYFPSLFGNQQAPNPAFKEPPLNIMGPAGFYPIPGEYADADIYAQCRDFLAATSEADRTCLVDNLGYALAGVDPRVREAILVHFTKINVTFGENVAKSITTYSSTKSSAGREMANKIRVALGNPPANLAERQSM